MNDLDRYPFIHAQPLADGRVSPTTYYLFNPKINRGFVVEGLAALFCRRMKGQKKLGELISEFEKDHELEQGKFSEDIKELIQDLTVNQLMEMLEEPKQ